jgi:hypothetical protein
VIKTGYVLPVATPRRAPRKPAPLQDQLKLRGIGVGPAGTKKHILSTSTDLHTLYFFGGRDLATFKDFGVGSTIPLEALFVPPQLIPNADLLNGLGSEIDENGWVLTHRDGATNIPGVRAAGNDANPRAQVITAAGEGSAAAIANAHLVEGDVTQAVHEKWQSPAALRRAVTSSPTNSTVPDLVPRGNHLQARQIGDQVVERRVQATTTAVRARSAAVTGAQTARSIAEGVIRLSTNPTAE